MVLEKIIIPEIQKVSGNVEKKICAVGITKLLTECPPMMDTEYTKLWQVLHSKILGDCSCLSLWLQHQPGSLTLSRVRELGSDFRFSTTNHWVQDMTCGSSGSTMILFPN